MLHTHSSIYLRRCIMFLSQHFNFPCQYHSTNSPYSFIHLPQTLYNVLLPVLQFLPSVSRRLFCSMSLRKPGFISRPFFARFLVNKVALLKISLPILYSSLSASFHQCSKFITHLFTAVTSNWQAYYPSIISGA